MERGNCMGRCIISIGSGGGAIDTDELTALPENVEIGKTAGVLGYDDPVPGILRNISNDSDILYDSNSSMHVIEGSNAYVSTNSDGISRAQIRFHETRGIIEDNTIIGISQNEMAIAGGLNADKLLAGQSAFGVNGTATNDADFDQDDLLVGKSGYKNGTKINGNMPNNGAAGTSLNCGGSYTIPKGFHNGSGKVTANSLASQTSANVEPNEMINGKTAWKNGVKITGTMTVQSILSFSAAPYSGTQLICSWKNPSRGPFSGVIIIGKTTGYPASINDGTRFYKGSGNNVSSNGVSSVIIDGFAVNTQYYLRAFTYTIKNNAEWVGSSLTATAKTIRGEQKITESGTFTVPANVKSIDIFCVGGGGGGTPRGGLSSFAASGGGGGYTATKIGYSVTPGQTFAVTIGAGGIADSSGGTTAFGNVLTAAGGQPGGTATGINGPGGDGGSGGGAGSPQDKDHTGATGGSDGSDGGSKREQFSEFGDSYDITKPGGKGQGITTRAFAISSETLYSGGGGGGEVGAGGAGGGGAAGAGHRNSVGLDQVPIICPGKPGGTNTGGGGGAGGWHYTSSERMDNYSGGTGGSGFCLVRWGY